MPQDSPYYDDGTIDWSFFDRPVIPGSVYAGDNHNQIIPLSDAQSLGYGSMSDEEKRLFYNETFSRNVPTDKPFLDPGLPLDQQTPNYGDLVPAPPVIVPSPNPDEDGGWGTDYSAPPDLSRSHADVTNNNTYTPADPDPKEIVTAGFSWSDFYDKFMSNMPPFSLFPGGTLNDFFSGFGDNPTESPEADVAQNIGNTFDLFSNPLILMILIMGIGKGRGGGMSSLLPLLILLPYLQNNLQGGQTV